MRAALRMSLLHTLHLTAALGALYRVGYIDVSVIKIIYLPVWAVSMASICLGKRAFGGILASSASIGLIAEYGVHLSRPLLPSMSGVFVRKRSHYRGRSVDWDRRRTKAAPKTSLLSFKRESADG